MVINSEKFIAMVHLVIHGCKNPEELGKTKLHKTLWFSEALGYLNWRDSITGEIYIKDRYGPVSQSLSIVLDLLMRRGAIRIENVSCGQVRKEQYISLQEPDLSEFSKREISLIKDVSHQVCEDHTAGTISELSHTRIWELAERWEELPHYALLASKFAKLSENDWDYVNTEIAKRTG